MKPEHAYTRRWPGLATAIAALLVWLFAQALCLGVAPNLARAAEAPAPEIKKTTPDKLSLHIYTWPGLLPQWLLDDFTASTGIPLELSFHTTSERLIASMLQADTEHFDLILSAEHIMPFLIETDLVLPLERSRLPAFNTLLPSFARKSGEKTYSLPLYWGILGVLVDTRHIEPEAIRSWANLWDDRFKGKLSLPADLRPCMTAALFALGYSPNTKSTTELREAWEKTRALAVGASVFSTHDICRIMQSGQAQISLTANNAWAAGLWGNQCAYNPAATTVEPSSFVFVVPQGRSVSWVISAAMPRGAENPNGAYRFLQYITQPAIAARLSMENGFATASTSAMEYLPKELRENTTLYPPAKMLENMERETKLSEELFLQLEAAWSRLLRELRKSNQQKGNVV